MTTKTKAHEQGIPQDAFYALDPYQVSALTLWREGRHFRCLAKDLSKIETFMLQGVAEALASGKSVMLTVENEQALQSIMQTYHNKSLTPYILLNGKPAAQDYFAHLVLARNKPADESTMLKCRSALRRHLRNRTTLETKLKVPFRPVFGDNNWLQALARSLQLIPHEARAVLSARLEISDFEWTPKEYWMLRGRIESFNKLSDLRQSATEDLKDLDLVSCEGLTVDEMRSKLARKLEALRDEGRDLLVGYASLIANYREARQAEYRSRIRELDEGLQNLEQSIEQGRLLYGDVFLHESSFISFSQQIKKQFSKSAKDLVHARSRLKQQYLQLLELIQRGELAELIPDWEIPELLTIENVGEDIKRLRKAVENCPARMSELLREQQKRLNANNIREDHPLTRQIRAYEKSIEQFIHNVNASELFHKTYEVNALSLTRKSRVVENIVMTCRNTGEALEHLEEFLFWNSFWNNLKPHIKSLLRTLELFDEPTRIEIFDYWYVMQLLHSVHPGEMASPADWQPVLSALESDLGQTTELIIRHYQHSLRSNFFRGLPDSERQILKSLSKQDQQGFLAQMELLSQESKRTLFPVQIYVKPPLKHLTSGYDYVVNLTSQNLGDPGYGNTFILTCRSGSVDSGDTPFKELHFSIEHCPSDFHWAKLGLSERLPMIKVLSSQFHAVSDQMQIYNLKKLQLFSFLGEPFDRGILEALDMPFKHQTGEDPDMQQQITESLLDNKKPVFILCWDGYIGLPDSNTAVWSGTKMQIFKNVGLHVITTWSQDWFKDPVSSIQAIAASVMSCIDEKEEQKEVKSSNPAEYAGS